MHLSIKEKIERGLIGEISLNESIIFKPHLERAYTSFKKRKLPKPRKFNSKDVELIRFAYSNNNNYRDLASQFGTCIATIDHVINGKGAYRNELKK